VHHCIWICVTWKQITAAHYLRFYSPTIIHFDLMSRITNNLQDYPVLMGRTVSFSGVEVYYQINLMLVTLCA
jgi:hypothetical protein